MIGANCRTRVELVRSLVRYADSEMSDVLGDEERGLQPSLSGGVVPVFP
jgi:hypothetical protein